MKNKSTQITPPRLANWLLLRFLKKDLAEEVLGDLEEKFYRTLNEKSGKKAKRNYWYQVLNYIRPFAIKNLKVKKINSIHMYRHFFKISWRNLTRNKVFSGIKIGGFAIGIAACILIALFVKHETGYDNWYKDGDRIYRIANEYSSTGGFGRWTNLYGPLKPVLEDHLPELEKVSRVVLWKWGNVGDNHIRKIESKQSIYEEGFFYADPELIDILEIQMVYGGQDALDAPDRIVISKSKAEKYFPGENPIGRQMVLNGQCRIDLHYRWCHG